MTLICTVRKDEEDENKKPVLTAQNGRIDKDLYTPEEETTRVRLFRKHPPPK